MILYVTNKIGGIKHFWVLSSVYNSFSEWKNGKTSVADKKKTIHDKLYIQMESSYVTVHAAHQCLLLLKPPSLPGMLIIKAPSFHCMFIIKDPFTSMYVYFNVVSQG